MELRACLDFLLSRGGTDPDPDPDPAACEGWERSGSGEFVIEVPDCLSRVHLRVDPVSGTFSDFAFWVRAGGGDWTRLAAARVSVIDCQLGLACHFEGTYGWRSGAELGVTVQLGLTIAAGGTVAWTLTRSTQ